MKREDILSEIKKIDIVLRRKNSGSLSGLYLSTYRGAGMEIEGVREYSEEDDFRLIDWNATARAGKPYSVVMQEERDLELYLLIDISSSMGAGGSIKPEIKTKLETAAVAAAVLGLSAASAGDKTAAIFFSGIVEETISLSSGRSRVISIAEKILDSFPGSPGSNLEAACSALPGSFRKKGICIIISDLEFNIPWKIISKISSKAEPAIFRIRDKFSENSYRAFSYEAASDDPESSVFISYEKNRNLINSQKKYDTDFEEAQKLRIPIIDIYTDDNIVEKIYTYFKSRKR